MTVVLLVAILLHRVALACLPRACTPAPLTLSRDHVNPFYRLTSSRGTYLPNSLHLEEFPLFSALLPGSWSEVREFGDDGGGPTRLIVDYKLGLFSLNAASLPATTLFGGCVYLIDSHGNEKREYATTLGRTERASDVTACAKNDSRVLRRLCLTESVARRIFLRLDWQIPRESQLWKT